MFLQYGMYGMYGNAFCHSAGGERVRAHSEAVGGGINDADWSSSVGFHVETRGRAGGREAQGVAVLAAACKARASVLKVVSAGGVAAKLLLENFNSKD